MNILIALSLRLFLQVQVDSETVRVIDCELEDVSGKLVSYDLEAKIVTAVADCTVIFSDSFE